MKKFREVLEFEIYTYDLQRLSPSSLNFKVPRSHPWEKRDRQKYPRSIDRAQSKKKKKREAKEIKRGIRLELTNEN